MGTKAVSRGGTDGAEAVLGIFSFSIASAINACSIDVAWVDNQWSGSPGKDFALTEIVGPGIINTISIGIGSDNGVVLSEDSGVTILSPSGSPRVLDKPVILSSGGSITNNENGMVWLITSTSVEDSRGVVSPPLASSVDGGSNWTLGNFSHEGVGVTDRYSSVESGFNSVKSSIISDSGVASI